MPATSMPPPARSPVPPVPWAFRWWSSPMAKDAKRIAKNKEGVDRAKFYSLGEAVKLVEAGATAKFNETIELAMNLGVDPRHSDQMVRGVVNLPNGTGRNLRVGVFAKGAKAEEAKQAGAEVVGAEDLF